MITIAGERISQVSAIAFACLDILSVVIWDLKAYIFPTSILFGNCFDEIMIGYTHAFLFMRYNIFIETIF